MTGQSNVATFRLKPCQERQLTFSVESGLREKEALIFTPKYIGFHLPFMGKSKRRRAVRKRMPKRKRVVKGTTEIDMFAMTPVLE